MSITAGSNALASDFINESQRNATPANDAGRAPKLEADGKVHPFFTRNAGTPNAGETINGATLPVPVYQNKTDNEVYACDGNDTDKLKFLGFAISNSTNGNLIQMQTNGIVKGFSGLDEGEKYYVSDTVGTIQNSPGTNEVLVGIAISQTELLIQKGRRHASGTFSTTATGDTTLTVGFRASVIRTAIINATDQSAASPAISWGVYTVAGGNRALQAVASAETLISKLHDTDGDMTVSAITDTTFTLNRAASGGDNYLVLWEAEGEL
jgi:hypothetical protein